MADPQSILRVVSPEELQAQEEQEQEQAQQQREEEATSVEMSSLRAHIQRVWAIARDHRSTRGINDRLLASLRAFNGVYEQSQLSEIRKFGGSEVYARVVGTKARSATALLRDVYFSSDRPWDLEATPNPKLPDDITEGIPKLVMMEAQSMAQAGQAVDPSMIKQRIDQLMGAAENAALKKADDEAKKATRKVDDYLVEGGFYDAFSAFLMDLPLFPFAIIKGPVVKMVESVSWEQGKAVVSKKPRLVWERVSPFDFYWSPGVAAISEGDVFERLRWTRKNLHDLLGLPGWNDQAIRGALEKYDGGLRDWMDTPDSERSIEEDREDPNWNRSDMIDAMEFHGNIRGKVLLEWGIAADTIQDPETDYHVQTWICGDFVLKVQLSPSPRKRNPYFMTSFEKVPGTPVGNSLVDVLSDISEVANAALRNLVNNMGMACLPADAVVYRHGQSHNGAAAEVTIGELWDKKHEPNSGLRRIKLRSVNETTGELFGNRVVDVVQNGVKPIFRVRTAAGYTIRATDNHRFLSDDGAWRELNQFFIGDNIAVNGASVKTKPECVDCAASLSDKKGALRCKSCAAKNSVWNRKQALEALANRDANPTTARARQLVQVHKKHTCESCGVTDREDLHKLGMAKSFVPRALHIHHVDKDPFNGAPDNLMTLCDPCHKEWHVRHGNFGDGRKHRFMDYDKIISIEHAGEEMTYDLQMTAPNHNFVADGYVVHNSGPQVVILDNRFAVQEDTDDIYPWKRWHMADEPGQGALPPVSFYQPQSNANELMGIYQKMTEIADEISAIPRYATGAGASGGAGRTASGLSMLMGNANKILQQVAHNIDMDILTHILQSLYDLLMLTGSDAVSGDENIVVRGVSTVAARETERARQLEFLQLTANEIDMSIIGPEGRAEILRAVADDLGMPVDRIVPSKDMIAEREAKNLEQQRNRAAADAASDEATSGAGEQNAANAQQMSAPANSTSPVQNDVQPGFNTGGIQQGG